MLISVFFLCFRSLNSNYEGKPEIIIIYSLFFPEVILSHKNKSKNSKMSRTNSKATVTPRNVIIAAKCNINAKCNKNHRKM